VVICVLSIQGSRFSWLVPVLVEVGKYWESKHVSDGEVSLTLESTSEVSLASRKILSNCSSSDFRYLLARDEGEPTVKLSSSELDMRGILVVPLVHCVLTSVHVGLLEVTGRSLRCDCRWIDRFFRSSTACPPGMMRSWKSRGVRSTERSLEYLDVDDSAVCQYCSKGCACSIVVQFSCRVRGNGGHGKYTFVRSAVGIPPTPLSRRAATLSRRPASTAPHVDVQYA
jgi:hypothetical protein